MVAFPSEKIRMILNPKFPRYFFNLVRREYFGMKGMDKSFYVKFFSGKECLEIGGPTKLFRRGNSIPIYETAKVVDGCNFSRKTLWEGKISDNIYRYDKNKKGVQYICDATDVDRHVKKLYDAVISSNCLEHVANPLKAMESWLRVLKKSGLILLILPNKKMNFDHRREVTLFSHILNDFKSHVGEDDLTHLSEIIKKHDLSLDLPAGNMSNFIKRSKENLQSRSLHHHVFNSLLIGDILSYFNLEIIRIEELPSNFVALARKR